jgi:hypothetical protein
VGEDFWPLFYINHPQEMEAYQIPEDAELAAWLVANYLMPAEGQEQPPEIRLEDVKIAGTTAVHLRFERSPHSYAYDKYFFANAGQLYSIIILHTGDLEEWELYSHFLDSFRFNNSPAPD